MSFEGGVQEVTELFTPEALIQRRRDLAQQLGECSRRVVDANQQYSSLIGEMIENGNALRRAGVDVHALGHEFTAPYAIEG